ncbi:unnamed protein product [Rotaria sp. Silwood1]|nr:unnamed protein product [Rotaria sp. Silwood1]
MSSHKASYEKWHDGISKLDLKQRRTCILYSKQQQLQQALLQQQQNDTCGCGRLRRSHSYENLSESPPISPSNDRWNYLSCSKPIEDTKNFGILCNPYESRLTKVCIRCDFKASAEKLYNLICTDCNRKPGLIISIYGGAKNFKMNERLEKEFMRGIIEATTVADGWILTTGLNHGVARLVAVSAKSKKFLLTAGFERVMNEAWYDKLDETNHNAAEKPMIILGLLSFGVLAPFYVIYRNQQQEGPEEQSPLDKEEPVEQLLLTNEEPQEKLLLNKDEQLYSYGVTYPMSSGYSQRLTCRSYLKRLISFHESPMIKMIYDFIANVWLLLTFSYMMLYHFDPPMDKKLPHWTEIFVIITVTTILLEHIRQFEVSSRKSQLNLKLSLIAHLY